MKGKDSQEEALGGRFRDLAGENNGGGDLEEDVNGSMMLGGRLEMGSVVEMVGVVEWNLVDVSLALFLSKFAVLV